MIKIVISLLLIIEGIRANEEVYRCPEENCERLPFPFDFPQDNDDLQKLCSPVIEKLQCQIHTMEGCEPVRAKDVEVGYRVLSTVRNICSEDTLLHTAVVDNLKCFSKLVKGDRRYCYIEEETYESERYQHFAEALAEEGIVSFTDNENETMRMHRCIESMFFFACHSQNIESKCGTVAMEAYVEIVQGIGPAAFDVECEGIFDLLPANVRLRKLAADIAEEVRKRK